MQASEGFKLAHAPSRRSSEFFPTDDLPWVPIPGAPPGLYEKVLTEDPDKMFVTRLTKADPGCAGREVFVHDFWEEVYIVEGSHWDGDQPFQEGNVRLQAAGNETWSLSDRRRRGDI